VRLAAEQDAVAVERDAIDAKDEVLELDDALRTTKAIRKAR
jgi:hypothetical protein